MGHSKGSSERKVYSNTAQPQERRTIPFEQSKLTINKTRKRRTNEAQVSRRRDIIKIRAEIIKLRRIKQQKESMKARAYSLRKLTKQINPQPDLSRKKENLHT